MSNVIYDLKSIKLINNTEEQISFFNYVMDVLNEQPLACLIIRDKIPKNIGGYFSAYNCVNRLVLPQTNLKYNKNKKTLKIKEFSIFLHECCHFLHLVKDNGTYLSNTTIKPKDKNETFDKSELKYLEYEAGYRSCILNNIYNLCPKKDVLKCNLSNMLSYCEFPSWYIKLAKMEPKFVKKVINEWIDEQTKFSICSSFKIDIPLNEKILKKLKKYNISVDENDQETSNDVENTNINN